MAVPVDLEAADLEVLANPAPPPAPVSAVADPAATLPALPAPPAQLEEAVGGQQVQLNEVFHTVQPKNNACARSGARSSCAASYESYCKPQEFYSSRIHVDLEHVYGKRERQNVILISLLFLLRERKKKHLTLLRKWLKGRRQKFHYCHLTFA